jgi:hypothetical protein
VLKERFGALIVSEPSNESDSILPKVAFERMGSQYSNYKFLKTPPVLI